MRKWIKQLFKEATPNRCIFRVDAGNKPGLSFGHVSRCMTFADLLSQMFNTQIFFVMRDLPDGIAHAKQIGRTLFTIPDDAHPEAEAEILIDLVDEINPDCFVLDLPYKEIDTTYFPLFKKKGIKTIFIDDCRFYNPGADIVLNSSVLAPEKFREPENKALFLGPAYFIFDDRLIQDSFLFDKKKTNIVISFGGADPTDLTQKTVQTLFEVDHAENVLFYIILGPGYANVKKVQSLVREKQHHFTLIKNPDNIIPFFTAADFVICAGGRTMYELSYLGKPFLPIASTKIEADAVEAFMEKGFLGQGLLRWDEKAFQVILKQTLSGNGSLYKKTSSIRYCNSGARL